MAVAQTNKAALQKVAFGPEVERALRWFFSEYSGIMDDLGGDLVDALRDGRIDPSSLSSIEAEVEHLAGEYTNDVLLVFREGTEQGAEAGRGLAARRYALDISFDLVPQRTLDEFAEWSEEATANSMETLTGEVTDLVYGAQEEGLSIPDIASQVDGLFENRYIEGWKAEQIARTATIPSSNAGGHTAYQDAPSVLFEEWLATIPSSRTRHTHREADGQVTAVDTPFVVGPEGHKSEARFPGDPTLPLDELISCRCTSIPRFADSLTDEQIATLEDGGRVWT